MRRTRFQAGLFGRPSQLGDVNTQDDEPWTPLHNAADYGHLQVIHMLIEHNASSLT